MDTSYPKNYFNIIKIIYAISALWLFNPSGSLTVRCLKYSSSIILYSCSTLFIILELMMFGETVKDIRKLIMHVGMLLSNLLGILKILIVITRHQRLEEFTETMQDEKYYYESVGEFDPGQVMSKSKKFITWIAATLFAAYSLIAVSGNLSVQFAISNEEEEHFETNTCYDFMPYIYYIPFKSDTKIACRLVAFYMNIAIWGMSFSIGCHDVILSAILECLKVQFVIVGEAFRTIRQRVFQRLNLPKDFEIFHDDQNPKLEEELYKEMCRTTNHFKVLLQISEELEDIFNLSILGQFLQCFVIIAAGLYVATILPINSPEFASLALYFIDVTAELTLFCWFTSGVTRATEEMMFSLYDCDWYGASKRFKTSLLITMMRLRKPVYLTLGKFGPLTLNSLVSVFKGAFSYYTLFKNVTK